MRTFALAGGLICLAAAAPPPPAPDWMAGAWQGQPAETGKDDWSDEFWTPMRGGVMLGSARIGQGGTLTLWEQTRIERAADGSLTFLASPRGAPASAFPMVARSELMIEFANAAHDYPQRIRYWREGKRLMARISMLDGSKAVEWSYLPMGE